MYVETIFFVTSRIFTACRFSEGNRNAAQLQPDFLLSFLVHLLLVLWSYLFLLFLFSIKSCSASDRHFDVVCSALIRPRFARSYCKNCSTNYHHCSYTQILATGYKGVYVGVSDLPNRSRTARRPTTHMRGSYISFYFYLIIIVQLHVSAARVFTPLYDHFTTKEWQYCLKSMILLSSIVNYITVGNSVPNSPN